MTPFNLQFKVGLALELSGKEADLGVQTSNGLKIAVDKVNKAGRIHGRQLPLVIKDDQGDPSLAQEVDRELVDAGVAAIIGHITS